MVETINNKNSLFGHFKIEKEKKPLKKKPKTKLNDMILPQLSYKNYAYQSKGFDVIILT